MMSLTSHDAIYILATAALGRITPGQVRHYNPIAMEWLIRKGYLGNIGVEHPVYRITLAGREALARANP